MTPALLAAAEAGSPPRRLIVLFTEEVETALAALTPGDAAFLRAQDFGPEAGKLALLPGADGAPDAYFCAGPKDQADPRLFRGLPARLPAADYTVNNSAPLDPAAALHFGLGGYVYDALKAKPAPARARLIAPGLDLAPLENLIEACAEIRRRVDAPANLMGPDALERETRQLAERFKARLTCVAGDALLDQNFPLVHAVGRAAAPERAPRFLHLSHGEAGPIIVLIGKGVAFDTGGLDLKPSSGMRLMKKDMGGAAHALGLAQMILTAGLKLRLHVLIPAVENAVGGDAFRPGDVIASRKGLSVEIGNTDAEGRLILADALTYASALNPDATYCFATLTGAARVALGPEVVPFYTDNDVLAAALAAASVSVGDPLWRLPLWENYASALNSEVADLKNDADAWAQAGSITAALFLKRFAPETGDFVHFDLYAWNPKGGPGRPVGAEAQAVRAVFAHLSATLA